MAQASAETGKRALIKPSEVCDRAKVQPYVLRTWEMEFPELGVTRTPGGPRLYRPSDVEQVMRIRQLVFEQGLTLAGARRRLEEERAPADVLPFDEPEPVRGSAAPELKAGLSLLKQEMRALLDLLSHPPHGNGHAGQAPAAPAPARKATPAPETRPAPARRAAAPGPAKKAGKAAPPARAAGKAKAAGKRRQAGRS